jgi:hypothetical protein
MNRITQALIVVIVLCAVYENSSAMLVLEGMSKQAAEKELGLVMRRERIGTVGSVTNSAGISIEFLSKGELEGLIEVGLYVYSERPTRLLTSTTLHPITQTNGKVKMFFVVDEDYLDRTELMIHLRRSRGSPRSDGYSISLSPKDFPPPNAHASSVAPGASETRR